MSRPSKFDAERAERVLEAIGAGATRRAAAGHAGIDHATLYRWLERNATFATQLRAREDQVEVRCVATIQTAMRDDWKAAAWWLERRRSADYGRRDQVDVTLRQTAERLGAELGISPDELIAEAERIMRGP